MLTFWKSRKSTGSGAVDQTPPKKSGYVTWSHRLLQPPDEWPVTNRAVGAPRPRKRLSIFGTSSSTIARPYGPLLSESAKTWWPQRHSGSSTTYSISTPATSVGLRAAAASAPRWLPPKPGTSYSTGYRRSGSAANDLGR